MTDVTIIPAQPGFTILYADEAELSRGEPVIAWAIDAEKPKKGSMAATVYPITPDGEPGKLRRRGKPRQDRQHDGQPVRVV